MVTPSSVNRPESIIFNQDRVSALQKLVEQGEGLQLEFKRKASYPDKVVRELIAFANTRGGTLLVGVDDDGSLPGLKYPEEESAAIHGALQKFCRPSLTIAEEVIRISEKKFVLQWNIPVSPRRPHFFVENGTKHALVRSGDQSMKASREMCEIIRRRKSKRDMKFTVGEAEQKLFKYLDDSSSISLPEFSKLTGLNRFLTSRKAVRLVLANVLKITPTEKGDLYSRVG